MIFFCKIETLVYCQIRKHLITKIVNAYYKSLYRKKKIIIKLRTISLILKEIFVFGYTFLYKKLNGLFIH
jgi:hypothetical protein